MLSGARPCNTLCSFSVSQPTWLVLTREDRVCARGTVNFARMCVRTRHHDIPIGVRQLLGNNSQQMRKSFAPCCLFVFSWFSPSFARHHALLLAVALSSCPRYRSPSHTVAACLWHAASLSPILPVPLQFEICGCFWHESQVQQQILYIYMKLSTLDAVFSLLLYMHYGYECAYY